MELLAEPRFEEGLLQAVVLVPDDAFEEGIEQADDERGGHALRQEARALGDAAGDDGGNRGGERAEEEELDQRQALRAETGCAAAAQRLRADEERHAVGDGVADEEVGDRRDGEIDQDLAERVDLVLVAHGAGFEKGEAAVHGKNKNCAHEQKQDVGAALQPLDGRLKFRHAPTPRFICPFVGQGRRRMACLRHRQKRGNVCQG